MQRKAKTLSQNGMWKRSVITYLMILPGLIYFIINNILPMYGITLAFRNVSYKLGPLNSPLYPLEDLFVNFEMIFKQDIIGILLRNTLLYNVVFIVLDIVIPVAVAILFNAIESERSKKIFQTAILLPNIISWVIVGYIGYAFLSEKSGVISHLLGVTDFYHNPIYWPFILTVFHLWKCLGMGMLIYVSALVGIDASMYEAAKLDGATWWQRTVHITLPHLKKMIITMFILSLARIMTSDFGLFYQLPRDIGTLYETTDVVDTYIFRTMRVIGDMGMGSAAGLLQSIIGFALVMLTNYVSKKIDPDRGLF